MLASYAELDPCCLTTPNDPRSSLHVEEAEASLLVNVISPQVSNLSEKFSDQTLLKTGQNFMTKLYLTIMNKMLRLNGRKFSFIMT
jgi:hypothetical protein